MPAALRGYFDCGVSTDELVSSYKAKPIIPFT